MENNEDGVTRSFKIIEPEEEKTSMDNAEFVKVDDPSEPLKNVHDATRAFMDYISQSIGHSIRMPIMSTLVFDDTVKKSSKEEPEDQKEEPVPNGQIFKYEKVTKADLRCGNWIRVAAETDYNDEEGVDETIQWKDGIYQIVSLESDNVSSVFVDDKNRSDSDDYHCVGSVVISDEIMKDKFGFGKSFGIYTYAEGGLRLELLRVGHNIEYNADVYHVYLEGRRASLKDIKYIHEVQNVFYNIFNRDIIPQI